MKPQIAIESTGNAEQDEAHLERAILSQERIDNGECPNGCEEPIGTGVSAFLG